MINVFQCNSYVMHFNSVNYTIMIGEINILQDSICYVKKKMNLVLEIEKLQSKKKRSHINFTNRRSTVVEADQTIVRRFLPDFYLLFKLND